MFTEALGGWLSAEALALPRGAAALFSICSFLEAIKPDCPFLEVSWQRSLCYKVISPKRLGLIAENQLGLVF
jgi:hypothetical protein